MTGFGGQPPFDHRKIPEDEDDIESTAGQLGCLLVIALIIGISVVLFLAGVRL